MNEKINLETILLSIQTKINKETIIDRLKNSGLLNTDEIALINEYERIFEETGKIPTPSMLVNINPQYKDIVYITSEDDLIQYVTLFIRDRLKTTVSSNIMNSIQSLNNGDTKTSDIVNRIVNEVNKLSTIDDETIKITTTNDGVSLYDETDLSSRFKTGLEPIDNTCGGIPEGSVTIVMGGTGSFKTMTTTNICYNAMNVGKNICYLSLEISKAHMYFNIYSRHSMSGKFNIKLPHKKIKNKELLPEEYEVLKLINKDLEEEVPGKFTVIDETDIKTFDTAGFQEIITEVDKNMTEKTGHGVDILVVDHAQLLKFSGTMKITDPYQIVNYYVSWLRQQSLNFLGQGRGISVIIVSQTSRAGMEYAGKHGGQYLLTHAAEANELERSASYVISVFANDMSRGSNELMIQLLKSRNSETMLEPQTVKINPAYYQIGGNIIIETVAPVFEHEDIFVNTATGKSLEETLSSIF